MPGKVTLVRKNGTRLDATPEQAERLKLLGYSEETPEAQGERLVEEAKEEYYTSFGQRAAAAAEGFGSGLSFGATDYLLGDEGTKERAQRNPGTRLAFEAAGALAPLVLSGGSSGLASAASKAPTALAARATEALAVGKAGSLTRAVSKGVIEGGLYGAAGAADHAYLDGDPITAEAVFHGLGWGAVLGGGLSALGHGVERLGKHEGAVLAAQEKVAAQPQIAENLRVAARNDAEAARYVDDLVTGQAEAATKTAAEKARFARELAATPKYVEPGALHNTAGAQYEAFRAEVSNLASAAAATTEAADDAVRATFGAIRGSREFKEIASLGGDSVDFVREVQGAERLYKKAMQAAERGRFERAMTHAAEYETAMKNISSIMATPIPGNSAGALKELINLRAVAPEAAKFPRTVGEFALMTPQRAERMLASLDQLAKVESPGVQALKETQDSFLKALGADAQTGMRGAWKSAKSTLSAEGRAVKQPKPAKVFEAEDPRPPNIREPREVRPGRAPEAEGSHGAGILRKVLGYAVGGKAYVAAHALGIGKVGSYAAYRGVRDAVTNGGHALIGLRSGFIGSMRQAAAEYLPRAGRAVQGARIPAALSVTLTGEPDTSAKDTQTLAANRLRELRAMAPNVNDTLFRALEPLAVSQPKLAPAMHAAGVRAFQALLEMAPKDPGVVSGLRSIWRPSPVQSLVFGKQLEVFHNPGGVAREMLATGDFDPVKVAALKEIAPSTWLELRIALLMRVSQPEVQAKMTYKDQIGLSTMLDLPLHTSMTPAYISAAQQAFVERAVPQAANPRMGQGGGMPDPQDNLNATQSQKSTAR